MEGYLNGSEKQQAVIQDYKEYHTDVTVKFVVQMAADKMRMAETQKGLHQFFKLQVLYEVWTCFFVVCSIQMLLSNW